jgi:hypothetical protein
MLTVKLMLVVLGLIVMVLGMAFKPLLLELHQWRQSRRVSHALRTGVLSMGETSVRVPNRFAWR